MKQLTQILLFFLAFNSVLNTCFAQTPDFEWASQLSGVNDQYAATISADPNGDIYITGTITELVDLETNGTVSSYTGTGEKDMYIQKVTPQGAVVWTKFFAGTGGNGGGNRFITSTTEIDAAGNLYVFGSFSGTIDFDPNLGVQEMTSDSINSMYILKLDNDGTLIWKQQFGGNGDSELTGLAPLNSGNILVSGYFSDTCYFDLGTGSDTLVSNGIWDCFVMELDPTQNLVWINQIGGIGRDAQFGLTVDDLGNIYTTGGFSSTVDFDPGIGVYNQTCTQDNDLFVQKLDASGNFVWARQVTSLDLFGYSAGFDLELDNAGNILVVGSFAGDADFDVGPGVDILGSHRVPNDPFPAPDVVVLKLENDGDYIWAKHIGGEHTDHAFTLELDASGNVYVLGTFFSVADFDPGPDSLILNSVSDNDLFLEKLDGNGDLLWVQTFGLTSYLSAGDLLLTDDLNLYLTGVFRNMIDVDPDNQEAVELTSDGSLDAFMIKLNQLYLSAEEHTHTSQLLVYPNPTSGALFIETEGSTSIQILDCTGRVVLNRITNDDYTSCNLSSFAPGLYYVVVRNDSSHKVQQIIKQ